MILTLLKHVVELEIERVISEKTEVIRSALLAFPLPQIEPVACWPL